MVIVVWPEPFGPWQTVVSRSEGDGSGVWARGLSGDGEPITHVLMWAAG